MYEITLTIPQANALLGLIQHSAVGASDIWNMSRTSLSCPHEHCNARLLEYVSNSLEAALTVTCHWSYSAPALFPVLRPGAL
jgi:hypothetical protein